MAAQDGKAGKKTVAVVSHEQIVAGFQEMRQEQRAILSKISELDIERKEHELVIEALKEVSSDRKCYRLVGGVLVERTVGEVLPALKSNCEMVTSMIGTLDSNLEKKGKNLKDYREKHNIRVRGEDESPGDQKENIPAQSQGVLVAKSVS